MANTAIEQKIAEINLLSERIVDNSTFYFIPELGVRVPKEGHDYFFEWFSLFTDLPHKLHGHYVNDDNRIYFVFGTLKVRINSAAEPFVLGEVFYNNCYRFRTGSEIPVVVIDIGMNVGIASMFFAQQDYVAKVYAYEPFPTTYNQALENLKMSAISNEKVFSYNFGLGGLERQLESLYDPTNSSTNKSVEGQSATAIGAKETITIKNVKEEIDRVVGENPVNPIIIKVDTEGAEYEIFDTLFEGGLHRNVKGFLVEWHSRGPAELEDKLIRENFGLISTREGNNTGMIYAFR